MACFSSTVFNRTWESQDYNLAAITLHNWLWNENNIGKIDVPVGLIDREHIETDELCEGFRRSDPYQESWYPISNSLHGNRSSNLVREVRQEFTEYIMNEGCVPWQWKSAKADIQRWQNVSFLIPYLTEIYSIDCKTKCTIYKKTAKLFYFSS